MKAPGTEISGRLRRGKFWYLHWMIAGALIGPLCGAILAAAAGTQPAALLDREKVAGLIAVVDVRSGELVASAGNVDDRVLPLSLVKVLLAASLLEHGIEDGVHEMIVGGSDDAGRKLAVRLRNLVGAQAVLADVRRFGFTITLAPDASDDEWGTTFSIGESHILATPLEVARFFRMIGNDSARVLTRTTQARLRSALLDVVERGTAKSIRGRVAGGSIGGKTGTGPMRVAPDSDGWFAGLVFDTEPRFAFATYVRKGGPGGGTAARMSADLATALLAQRRSTRSSGRQATP
jgi:hypothetical protein